MAIYRYHIIFLSTRDAVYINIFIYFLDNPEATTFKPITTTKQMTSQLNKYCSQKTVNGLFWPKTEIGITRTVNCGQERSKFCLNT